MVACSNSKEGLDCRAGQSLFFKKTGQRFLSVAVRIEPETKKPSLLVQLPLGVYLPAGVTLQIGKDAAKTLPYKNCDRGGCIAEYPITDAELAAMVKGADITLSAQSLQQKSFTLDVPGLGFAAAYAKIK
jgi:invasion protein IalB